MSNLMRRLLTDYVIGFNQRRDCHGQLFQNRFKSIVCQEDLYLKELVRYIHLNPIWAGLVPNLAGLQRYRYCRHAALMGDVEVAWQETEYVLVLFGNSVRSARLAYGAYMEDGLRQGGVGRIWWEQVWSEVSAGGRKPSVWGAVLR